MARASLIVLAHGDAGLAETCVESLLAYTELDDAEIVIFDNGSVDAEAARLANLAGGSGARLVRSELNLGFSAGSNAAAREARGQALVFLNNDIEARLGWLEPLLTALERPDTGIAGSLLLYPGGTVQHAGIGMGLWGLPAHLGRDASPIERTLQFDRFVMGVTGACLAIKRDFFSKLGGFDERFFFSYEDVDLCLRARLHGRRTLYCNESVLVHHESATLPEGPVHAARGEAQEKFMERWGLALERAAERELKLLEEAGAGRAAIFGTGSAGRRMLDLLRRLTRIEAACFADSRERMEGAEVEGLPVHHISRLPAGIDTVLGASMFAEQLMREAERAGVAQLFRTGIVPDIGNKEIHGLTNID